MNLLPEFEARLRGSFRWRMGRLEITEHNGNKAKRVVRDHRDTSPAVHS
jgi:hypothetical protein